MKGKGEESMPVPPNGEREYSVRNVSVLIPCGVEIVRR